MNTLIEDNENTVEEQTTELLRTAMARAAEDIQAGVPTEKTVAALQMVGLDAEDAAAVYSLTLSTVKRTHRRTGATYIVTGFLWMLVAVFAVVLRLAATGTSTGRFTYLMMFLACLGLMQIGIGLLRLRRASRL